MIIDFDTHSFDWRRRLRATDTFACLVTPAWHQDPHCQRQLVYARQLGKPIVFLVQEGTPLPPVREGEDLRPWRTAAELAGWIAQLAEGEEQ
jgi:hypothetical protein